jgi:hypothetical protein
MTVTAIYDAHDDLASPESANRGAHRATGAPIKQYP